MLLMLLFIKHLYRNTMYPKLKQMIYKRNENVKKLTNHKLHLQQKYNEIV